MKTKEKADVMDIKREPKPKRFFFSLILISFVKLIYTNWKETYNFEEQNNCHTLLNRCSKFN